MPVGGKLDFMTNIIEKVQYSLIYMLYRAKIYKSGRGYFYRANQIISLILCFAVVVILQLSFDLKIVGAARFIGIGMMMLLLFFFFEKNTKRRKLMRHRATYIRRNKYLVPFYIFSAIVIGALFLINM